MQNMHLGGGGGAGDSAAPLHVDRVVLHVDMDGFYASVEELSHPEARGRPMAVCGDPASRRGIILAKNQLAKQAGVKTAEPIWQAARKCPGLLLLPPRHGLYATYCDKANAIYERFTDLVECAGIDESYLDVTASRRLFGDGERIADAIRAAVRGELGITASVGVSFCKLFAKMGSDLKKPDSTNVVSRARFRELLHPLPVTALMYVGKATAESLARIGVYTVGQLAAMAAGALGGFLGKQGRALHAQANGLDDEPVRRTSDLDEAKSIGNSMTFRRDLVSRDDISIGLRALSASVARRLRAHGRKCYGVQVAIKDPELKTIGRQMQLPRPTHLTKAVYEAALSLTLKAWKVGKPIRLLSVTAINLTGAGDGGQMSLFADDAGERRQEALERSLDALRERYGGSAVRRAATLHNDLGLDDLDEQD